MLDQPIYQCFLCQSNDYEVIKYYNNQDGDLESTYVKCSQCGHESFEDEFED